MSDFFVEVLSEEIPARFQTLATDEFKCAWLSFFKNNDVIAKNIKVFVTPRRLVLVVKDIYIVAYNNIIERRGPSIDQSEVILRKFFESINLVLDKCIIKKTIKGTFLFINKIKKNQDIEDILSKGVFSVIESIPWPKSMRWGWVKKSWVRPIQSVIALFNGRLLTKKSINHNPYLISIINKTRGHRFMGNREFFVSSFEDYKKKLEEENVILDSYIRRKMIIEQANQCVKKIGVDWVQNNRLLEETTGLVEYPVVFLGQIDKKFMSLPEEIMVTYMQDYQRYFICRDKKGYLAPYFLIISNIKPVDGGKKIIEGNERVLRSRFADAQFYKFKDEKLPFINYANKLSELTFHEKLGSMEKKVKRIALLVMFITKGFNIDVKKALQVVKLCKADLMTSMVMEFPKLQGIIGRYYSKEQDDSIAQAIEEHYYPRGAFDNLPNGKLGRLVGLADRIDTIVGFFAIGIRPTGSKDPYALRRMTIASIRLIESGFNFILLDLISYSYNIYRDQLKLNIMPFENVIKDLLLFFLDRIKIHWGSFILHNDIVTAVFNRWSLIEPLPVLRYRARLLSDFFRDSSNQSVLDAYRRASSILYTAENKDKGFYDGFLNETLLIDKNEKFLAFILKDVEGKIEVSLKKGNFEEAIACINELVKPINNFFKYVFINTGESSLRKNRLKLLSYFITVLKNVVDFSYFKQFQKK